MVVVCPNCGYSNPDDARLCTRCSAPLERSLSSSADLTSRLTGNEYERYRTDMKISGGWALILVLIVVPSVFITFYSLGQALYGFWMKSYPSTPDWLINIHYLQAALEIVFAVLTGFLVAKLIRRLIEHSDREGRFIGDFVLYVRTSAKPEQQAQILDEVLRCPSAHGRICEFETKPNPRRWGLLVALSFVALAILSIISLRGPYLFSSNDLPYIYFLFYSVLSIVTSRFALLNTVVLIVIAIHLMRTLRVHEARWQEFVASAIEMLGIIGKKRSVSSAVNKYPTRERSVLWYAFFTIATFGIFGFYWLYTLIDDPNRHFEKQATVEDELFDSIRHA